MREDGHNCSWPRLQTIRNPPRELKQAPLAGLALHEIVMWTGAAL
jgi:hypothetical protein